MVSGGNYAGTIIAGDLDLWSFDASAGDQFILRVGTSSLLHPAMAVYAPDGSLAGSTFNATFGDALLTLSATNAGTYTVVLQSYDTNANSGTYTLHFAQTHDAFIVPAGDQGGPLTDGVTQLGTNSIGDLDLWIFFGTPGDTEVLQIVGTGFAPRLDLYDPTGVLAASAGSGVSSFTLTYRVTNGGTYCVVVQDYYTNGASGSYTLLYSREPPPANDDFANRIPIAGLTNTVFGTNTTASKEPNEPQHAGNAGGRSIWWSWTAPANLTVLLDTLGSSFDTLLAVYTGNGVSGLTAVASDNDGGPLGTSRLAFSAQTGVEYQIAVDGFNGATGSVTLHLTAVAPPGNDDFAGRFTLTGMTNAASASNFGATKEPGEPNHAGYPGGSSVWWKWTAPANGQATVWTTNSPFSTLLAIYAGGSVSTLVPVAGSTNGNAVIFAAEGGTEYEIAVDGSAGGSGPFTLNLRQPVVPINDDFVDALPITGSTNSVTGSNVGATAEPFELGVRIRETNSVWWKWTAPASGGVLVDTTGSSFTTVVVIYTGSSVSNLTAVHNESSLVSTASFVAVAGTEYHLGVYGVGEASGSIVLNLQQNPLFLSYRLTISAVTPGIVNLTFWGPPNSANWTLQRAVEPSGLWTNLGSTVLQTNGEGQFVDNAPLQPAAFYRIKNTTPTK